MAVTAFATGTQLAVITTEHFLANVNLVGVYTFHVDTVNMEAGDVVELRVYQMTLTLSTVRVAYLMTYYGAQPTDDVEKICVPISNELVDAQSLRFSLLQTFGVGRNFPWKVLRHA